MNKVDKQLELEKFLHDIVGDEEFMSSQEYQKLLDNENNFDSERYKILDMLCWISDKKDELYRAKDTIEKYGDNYDKAFNYIFKKLPAVMHMNKEVIEVLNKINKKALDAYKLVLEYSIKDRELNIQKWEEELNKLDNEKYSINS